ncbi:DUF2637 domain-containing protein [Streptomyces lavendulocolor]
MKRPDATQALAAGAALVTIALTAAAFWLSYEHLHDIAGANGLEGARAWAWPATVDLFIIAGELLVLRASLRGVVDWWAYTLAASGSGGSIALNVFGVGTGAQPMEYVVAAVPPTAALVAFGALMRQVHDALHRTQTAAPEPVTAPEPPAAEFDRAAAEAVTVADAPERPALAPARPALVLDLAPMPPAPAHVTADAHPTAPAPASPPAASTSGDTASDADLIQAARALAATGPLSLRRMQRELRIGQTRAQRIRDALDGAA